MARLRKAARFRSTDFDAELRRMRAHAEGLKESVDRFSAMFQQTTGRIEEELDEHKKELTALNARIQRLEGKR